MRLYDKQRQAAQGDIASSVLQGLDNEIKMIVKFDHFFQEVCEDGRPDLNIEFDEEWWYYVVDFQGWSHRSITLSVAKEYYILFSSSISHEDDRTIVLFCQWEPMDNVSMAAQLTELMDINTSTSMVRGSLEIRELHRSKHTPEHGSLFDWNGCPYSRRDSLVIPSHPSRPQCVRVRGNTSSVSQRWLAQMSSVDTQSEGSSRSESRSSLSHLSKGQMSDAPSRPNSCTTIRSRSALPRPHLYHQHHGALPSLCRQAIENLQESGAIITHIGSVWEALPGLEWNATFYQESIILFPNARTLTRLKYWAITNPEVSHMRHLLDFAIAHNMCFVMATKIGNLKSFKPVMMPDLAELSKRTYEVGFQEEHLKDINRGAAFRDQYMGKLADILCRPQARALISMGGPAAWIAKRYGSSAIVQRFMDGPSTQVTVHHRGAVTSSPFCDDPLFYNQISAQEENLVHGFMMAENPDHHRWLFPTMEIMEDFCHHWNGEWTEGCDSIFHNIAKSLEKGTAKLLMRKGWKSYLHSTNHGIRCPAVILTPEHFSKVDELLLPFSGSWDGKRITDITIPIQFDSLSGN